MIHDILNLFFTYKRNQFIRESTQLEAIQKKKLQTIFQTLKRTQQYKNLSSSEEIIQGEIKSYSDYEILIDRQIKTKEFIISPNVARYEYTSGSTKSKKIIPYSKEFLNELNEASSVWMADLYKSYPGIKNGPHYWTLSWSPDQETDDSELFPFAQRFFLQKILVLNQKIKMTPTLESSWFATLVNLVACRNLSLISIWSPTLLMRIKKDIQEQAPAILDTLKQRKWKKYGQDLNTLLAVPAFDGKISLADLEEFKFKTIWPNLTLVSAWDSATSRFYFDQLKSHFPGIAFQGKGLWATEGVVTIPFENKKVLSFKSHFYQFRCVQTGKILFSWQLEKDQIVEPIISGSNGIVRYLIEDRIQVCDYFNQVPCFEFLGRNATSDMVGEKLSDTDFQNYQNELHRKFPVQNSLFVAVNATTPFYACIAFGEKLDVDQKKYIQFFLENNLISNFNYKVARNLNQLSEIKILLTRDFDSVIEMLAASYSAQGQFKLQALYRMNEATFQKLLSQIVS